MQECSAVAAVVVFIKQSTVKRGEYTELNAIVAFICSCTIGQVLLLVFLLYEAEKPSVCLSVCVTG